MRNSNINVFTFATVIFFMIVGCEKKISPNASDSEKPILPTVPTIPKSPVQELKSSLPISLVSPQIKIEFKYATDKNFITEIKQSEGMREEIDYNDKNYPKEYRRFSKDELVYHVFYITNQQGLVTKGIQYKVESGGKVLTLVGNYQISYNDKQLISEVNWYDFKNNLTTSHQYGYDEKQYLISKRTTAGTAGNITYSYDDKSGIFKSATYVQLLSLENDGFYLLNSMANIISVQHKDNATEDLKVVNQYNSNNQPSTITIADSGNRNKVYKVTYR